MSAAFRLPVWVLSTLALFSFLSLRSRLSSGTCQTHFPFGSRVTQFAVQADGPRKSRETSSARLTRRATGTNDGHAGISWGTLLSWLALYSHTSRHSNGTFVPRKARSSSRTRRSWWAVTPWRYLWGFPAPPRVELPFLFQQLVDSSQNSRLHLLLPALGFQALHPGLQLGGPKVGEQAEPQRAQGQRQESAAAGAREQRAALGGRPRQRHHPGRAQIPRPPGTRCGRFATALRYHPFAC